MAWEVVFTPTAQRWYAALPARDRERFARRLDLLRARGPNLGRPAVDSLKGARHHNLKELRVAGSPLRLLFAFDSNRRAIMLAGGSKAGKDKRFYAAVIRTSDRLLEAHLQTLARETTCRATRAGTRSAGRAR